MPHDNAGTNNDLALYRLARAHEELETAKLNFEAQRFKAANNRAYYAIFHAINAVHALDGKAYKRHKDVIANFNKDYVKTGIFPKDVGRKIAMAEEIRHASDYDDFYIAIIDDVQEQIASAEEIISAIQRHCESRIESS